MSASAAAALIAVADPSSVGTLAAPLRGGVRLFCALARPVRNHIREPRLLPFVHPHYAFPVAAVTPLHSSREAASSCLAGKRVELVEAGITQSWYLPAACKDAKRALEVSQHAEDMGLILAACVGGLLVLVLLLGAVVIIVKKG